MKLSKFGRKFTGDSGILQLMRDLGAAATGEDILMLGGGNPAQLQGVETHLRQSLLKILENGREFERLVGAYGPPDGQHDFNEAVAHLLREQYGWNIGANNIALTNGSQTAFFYLFNLFAGDFEDGSRKKILLPLTPEYIGYLDVGLVDDFFVASRPEFEFLDGRLFKYHVDFDSVKISHDIGAICLSRPTNPTGNVLTDAEIERLDVLARAHHIPLIIDNAYGPPFPNIVFTEIKPIWNENTILCLSLSKMGLPGVRTGIVVANEQVTAAIAGLNAVLSLAPGNFGAGLGLHLMRQGKILELSERYVRPHYQAWVRQIIPQIRTELEGVDYYIHKPEGAFFLWLWFKDLPISSQTLYERLKQRRVVVIPGQHFFPGLKDDWPHKHECIRVNYALDMPTVSEGISLIADEVKKAYALGA